MSRTRPRVKLEVCIASADDAIAATQAGADRLELNVALELGGLTPSAGLMELARQATHLPIMVMIRPRADRFCYSRSEFQVMLRDAATLLELGADGLVFGILTEQAGIDVPRCRALIEVASGHECVFHRAFDAIAHPEQALETIIDLGFRRVLTSGLAPSAFEGIKFLAHLNQVAQDRITILPGGGIRSSNVAEIVQRTGCREVHGSFSRLVGLCPHTDPSEVQQVKHLLNDL